MGLNSRVANRGDEDEGRIYEPEPPRIRVTFQASCAPCEYEGPGRASSLTALDDFDRHVDTAAHRGQLTLALVEVEPRCDHCGRTQDDSPAGFADADWNGETGNHETCEAFQ